MNYELAKKLKDAGFNGLEHKLDEYDCCKKCDWIASYGRPNGLEDLSKFCYPTLEELIEACGDEFEYLTKYDNEWIATSKGEEREIDGETFRCDSGCCGLDCTGKTPSESVAKLWLEINK